MTAIFIELYEALISVGVSRERAIELSRHKPRRTREEWLALCAEIRASRGCGNPAPPDAERSP